MAKVPVLTGQEVGRYRCSCFKLALSVRLRAG